ncbi:Ionotropic glutamate kainate receptor 2-like b [Caligus rogercresseyi]|uniref:Ionotropic glutamate kainate receptor 2-like b n=1 Tax=Caligus rogercresseyi TaxID=217165 RepID=A0A7T8JXY0_CALRO|nr:Ionotropic glutamate kainate receptor 2-like b [Caligus rogercresseyi]
MASDISTFRALPHSGRSLEELITYRAIFPRGSPWAANFSRLFGELHEEGKLQALQETWFSNRMMTKDLTDVALPIMPT